MREKLTVSPVDTLGEALAITVRDTVLRDGRLFVRDAVEQQLTHGSVRYG